MFMFLAPRPTPERRYWRGRCVLAALDAVVWPALWALVISANLAKLGVVGPVALAVVTLAALRRTYHAIFANRFYQFTTWRWGWYLVATTIVGFVLKKALV